MSSAPGPASRATLLVGVAVTASAFAALLVILGCYAAGSDPHPGLYWLTLWGFPAGFALMCLYVLLSVARRRRLNSTGGR
ncbi:hypothetical protein [Nesterenkonia sp.]|uniref:hypothetical protein n=1 Tax=Nesterenkonia sp. TaxID=704201 RepID=UPI002613982E|nr:hypothetical protein [Nesterenkonia sp.]